MPTLDCLHRLVFLHVYRSVFLARMRRYMQLAYLFHQCAMSLLSRDGRIADCTVPNATACAPNATACKRWECGVGRRPKTFKSGGEVRPYLQQPQPCPREGASLRSFFSASRPHAAATWAGGLLAQWALLTLITLAGELESNPGSQTKYICSSCNKNITRFQGSIRCNITPTHWTHIKCSGINIRQYTDKCKCNVHKAPSNTTQTEHQKAQHKPIT